ncbi:methylated-DNA--[protein]-cysteine S-methyltransferase, partial [Saccharomonospora saliphila]
MTARCGFAVFETRLGVCGLVFSAEAVLGCRLPTDDAGELRSWVRSAFPEAVKRVPEGHAARAVAGITALLRGEHDPLADVPLDTSGVPPFHRRVYDVVRTIAPGHTRTYGEVAEALG